MVAFTSKPCLGHCSAGLSGSSYRKSKEAFVAEFLAIRKYHGMGFYMFLSPLIPLSIGTYWNQSHDSCVVVWNEVLLLGPGRAAFGLLRRGTGWPVDSLQWTRHMNRTPLPCSHSVAQKAQARVVASG